MKEHLIQFFDKFVEDFESFDGTVIASRYLAPYTAISSDKSVSLYKEQGDIEQHFASILASYKKQNIAFCRYVKFEFSTIGTESALTTMDWNLMKKDGTTVTSWRESYLLIWTDGKWKIITSIDQ